ARINHDLNSQLRKVTEQREELERKERNLVGQINDITSRQSIAEQTAAATQSGLEARNREAEQLEKEIEELRALISSEENVIDDLRGKAALLRDQKDNIEIHTKEYEARLHEHDVTR